MSYCLNPLCQQPDNPRSAIFCQQCGAKLVLDATQGEPSGGLYRAIALIGQGGFGRTFIAVDDRQPDRPRCVIKQFLPQYQGGGTLETASRLFRQEATQLERLGQHPQIPALLTYFEQDGRQYLVQEYIDGRNLEQELAEDGPFTEAKIRQVLASLLPVLQFIHDHQVIHRDIKPTNVIRRSPSSSGSATGGTLTDLVLVDLGAAKFATRTALARTGTMIGSAGYAAPEQVMGRAEFSSDLYSLGVMCIHLLTGEHPFDLYSASEDAWVWQPYVVHPVSDRLTQVLNQLLQRATSQRYRTASAVLQALKLETRPTSKLIRSEPAAVSIRATVPTVSPPALRLVSLAERNALWECRQTLGGHEGMVTAVAVSPDGLLMASGSTDKTIKLWALETGTLLHTFGGRSLRFRGGHSDRISALAFSADGQTLLSSSDDCTLKWWDLDTRRLISTISGHGWVISAIAFSSNGTFAASGGGDGLINLWDLETGEPIATLRKHRERISALILSPDGQTLISSSDDQTIRLWDLRANRLITTLRGHTDRISALAITPDWLTLISAGWDKTVRFWDLGQGVQVRSLMAHKDRVTSLAIDPGGLLLASGGEDSCIKLWDLAPDDETGISLPLTRPLTLQTPWTVNAIAFSPDGHTLVSGNADETLRLWQRV